MKKGSSWFTYWNQINPLMFENMKKNREIFLKNSAKLFSFGRNDVVLDIGCGPGYMEEYLKDKVKSIYCLETSELFLKVLNNKFEQSSNVFIYKLKKDNYTNLGFLKSKKFTIVLCIGVVPYYKDVDDLKNLIVEVRKHCEKGIFLIADIKVSENVLRDIWGIAKMALRERYFINPTLFLLNARFSSYYKSFKKHGLLVIPETKLQSIIKELNLSAEIIDISLSLNADRKHLLIRF